MIILGFYAFLAGIVTILSPCILPVLPILLSATADTSGRRRPLGIVLGFVVSFTFFTLFLSLLVSSLGIPAGTFRTASVLVLGIFGLAMIIPRLQIYLEMLGSRLTGFVPHAGVRTGFSGGFIIGITLGLLWTPCVGPILASVISLALTGSVNIQAFFITIFYSLGTAIPMFIIMSAGTAGLKKVPWLVRNTAGVQKAFGVLMILTSFMIFFNLDRSFQTWVLNVFPSYGSGLTEFEDNVSVIRELRKINRDPKSDQLKGKTMADINIPDGPSAPELIPGGTWLNSSPLKLSELKNKVVLIDFWTYSCINCQRTLPYLSAWWDKYRDSGLVIIGIHSPEFEFEKDPENVADAIRDFSVRYPVMQDNGFDTWRAYGNRYWPAKYLLDKDGIIRYTHFGEGKYDETEKMIRQLLAEKGSEIGGSGISNPDYVNFAGTPELYLGYGRIDHFASPERITENTSAFYSSPAQLSPGTFAYRGEWSVMSEYAAPARGSELVLNFEAREVFLVARPEAEAAAVRVLIDDKPFTSGADNKEGVVYIGEDRLYRIILLDKPGRHILKLRFEDNNAQLYAFTFG